MEIITIQQAMTRFLVMVKGARRKNTAETYGFALRSFSALLADVKMDVEQAPVSVLTEDHVSAFADWLKKDHSTATEQLYLQAVTRFYVFLAAEQLLSPNMLRLRQLLSLRARKTGQRLPQFPREAIEQVLEYVQHAPLPLSGKSEVRRMKDEENQAETGTSDTGIGREKDLPPSPALTTSTGSHRPGVLPGAHRPSALTPGPSPDTGDGRVNERLRWLRDRAFLLTLADTGLRVHEACALTRGKIDWNEGRAIITGKGDKQAVIRFSSRCMAALKDYLSARSTLDGASGKQLAALPMFARHDKGAGKKVKAMTTATGRNIVAERVREALESTTNSGEAGSGFITGVGQITPHSFRHYFVTTVLRASGNLKLAQELARHANISVTQRYAHISDDELDKGYFEIFEKGE